MDDKHPSKAAMDAAEQWLFEWVKPGPAQTLADAFGAFAASQSAALLEALELVTRTAAWHSFMPETQILIFKAIAAAKERK